MIRVYFGFEDPLDERGFNLSYVDVLARNPKKAFDRVEKAAESGELWKNLYPDDDEHPYTLFSEKMMYVRLPSPKKPNKRTLLPRLKSST